MASNRSHNRMTFIDPVQQDKIEIDNNGKRTILLSNGERKIDASRFTWDRDATIVHPTLKLTIQYKMLEDIYSLINNVKLEEKEKIKQL